MIGTPRSDKPGQDDPGSVYVFVRSGATWTQQAKLQTSDSGVALFGFSTASSGDTVLIGAYVDPHAGQNSGSAYVFVRSGTTWTQQAKLTAADAAAGDEFGFSVTLSGNTAVIGADNDKDAGPFTGSAYVFVRSGGSWTQQAKLTASDPAEFDFFGSAVAVSGNTTVIGAFGDDDAGDRSGSASVFVRSGGTWTQRAKLTASDAASLDFFGFSTAISGNAVLVGTAFEAAAGSPDVPSVYVFVPR